MVLHIICRGSFSFVKGHHEAAACLAASKEFYCLIIEPVNNLYRDEDTNEIVGLCGIRKAAV